VIIKKMMIIALFVCFVRMIDASNALYLENQSNGTIAYTVNDRQEKLMDHGVRHLLGTISGNKLVPRALVKSLSVRSAGRLSWVSSYSSLNEVLKDIKADQLTSCQLRWPRCTQNAVIRIQPSSIVSQWNVSVEWEKSGKIEEFTMEEFR
jgi:hypothetical protein